MRRRTSICIPSYRVQPPLPMTFAPPRKSGLVSMKFFGKPALAALSRKVALASSCAAKLVVAHVLAVAVVEVVALILVVALQRFGLFNASVLTNALLVKFVEV